MYLIKIHNDAYKTSPIYKALSYHAKIDFKVVLASASYACMDPESFVRGGSTFFSNPDGFFKLIRG